ncbi:cadherin EGF LAG seven-pass G-type receptor 2-like [Ruditapes philippinarum]|uniref:cadherin EGF LAG seven-pass G-type receptor 2-like n=1 Tax=Ruditapes philippinarum TaxID=129788 RepID=UPI00295B5A63|nr:cadherin EGF LAG seven-pass G-type receptor 2-like [Ruditapes philippinarum]
MMRWSITTLMLVACLFKFGDAVPTFTTPANGVGSVNLDENVAAGHRVITVAATVTTGQTLTRFTLITRNTPFVLGATTGVLSVYSPTIDYETTKTYVLTIEVVDSLPSTATATLSVLVQDENEAPSFSAARYSVCAKDGSAVGTTVTSFTATDPEDDDPLTYSIQSGNTDTDFSVETSFLGTTYLTVAKMLNRCAKPSYTLDVQVSDGSLTDSATFDVTVSTACENGASARVSSLAALLIGLIYAMDFSLFRN